MSSKKESRNLLDELETLQQVLDDAAGEKVDLERALTQLNTVDEIPVLSDLMADEGTVGISPLKPVTGNKAVFGAPVAPTPGKVATLRPVSSNPSHPLDLRPNPRPLSPSEALDALHKQIDALPEEQRSGEDWFGKDADVEDIPTLDSELDELEQAVTLDDILDADDDTAAPSDSETEAPAAESTQNANPFLPQAVLDRLTRERLAAQHSAEEAHRTMQRVNQRMDQKNAEAAASLSDQARDKLIEEMIQEMIPHIQARLRERLRQMLKPQPTDGDKS